MYAPFFGLNKEPFSIAPDPRFLYMSERHREALAHLLYGLSAGGGFVLLTGEIGAGKTTVCRGFLEQVPTTCKVAYIFNPQLTVPELLRTVCDEFGVHVPAHMPAQSASQASENNGSKAQVDALNRFLLEAHAQGQQAVLVIDEAQSLSAPVLEQLRLLTNLETAERKLLQIILIGQPELRDMLARPELEQLAQRVIARYHLDALTREETPLYIRHRLAVAGPNAPLPFDAAALARIHTISGGVPRRINLLADRALLGAYAQGQHQANAKTVDQAAKEVFGPGAALGVGALAAPLATPVFAGGLGVGKVLAMGAAAAALLAVGWVASAAWRQPSVVPAATKLASGAVVAAPAPVIAPAQGASSNVPGWPASAGVTTTGVLTTTATTTSDNPSQLLSAAHRDAATAWRELALRWNVAIGEGDPCAAAPQAQLACFRATGGGLALARQLARPAVLVLRGADGRPVYALLTGLTDQTASLQVGDRRWQLSLGALAAVWRGDLWTLWRTPPGWRATAEAGADGNSVNGSNTPVARTWLTEQTNRSLGSSQPAAAAPLAERIRLFQMAQGLAPDGRPGPVTLMRLNRSAGVAEPDLAVATAAAPATLTTAPTTAPSAAAAVQPR
jgi:general secretion pathway protein A